MYFLNGRCRVQAYVARKMRAPTLGIYVATNRDWVYNLDKSAESTRRENYSQNSFYVCVSDYLCSYASSSRCHVSVFNLWLWHFQVIITRLFSAHSQ